MFKVPVYTRENYQSIINTPYHDVDTTNWIAFSAIPWLCQDEFLTAFSATHAAATGEAASRHTDLSNKSTWLEHIPTQHDALIALKLLLPTLRTCTYFYRDRGGGTHNGIDLILPLGTPIPSFTDGKVTRIKKRDGLKKDGGNSVTIRSGDQYRSYLHLDAINVTTWQQITAGETIGTCGTTGYSTQYHLHLQIDKVDSPYQPYRSGGSMQNVIRYSFDPLTELQQLYADMKPDTNTDSSSEIFSDMPTHPTYKQAITKLYNLWIIKWHEGKVYPTSTLKRYEFALMIKRIVDLYKLDTTRSVIDSNASFTDINDFPQDVQETILFLSKHGIMSWHNNQFSPTNELKWEEVLAVLGRMFYGTKNYTGTDGHRYRDYLRVFTKYGHIPSRREFVGNSITRQETMKVIAAMVK